VDDKIAIQEQIRSGLADTTWKVDVQPQALLALESIAANIPDVVLVSLSLPGGAGFVLFQKLRGNLKTERLPVFALSVKTAVEEQVRAQQLGFTGTITKPIDTADLKIKIARALNLDASYKYFNQKEGVLVLSLPANFSANIASDITMHLGEKVTEAVDAGVDTLVIDLSSLKTADNTLVELGLHVMKLAQSLSLKTGFVGAEMICEACKNYQETKEWTFAGSFDEIMMTLQTERSEVV
jgi:DNA-binding response OmpR family regulator